MICSVALLALAGLALGAGLRTRRERERQEALGVAGERIFRGLGCDTCHGGQAGARGPTFVGLYGSEVFLRDGEIRIADEAYLRESIWNPGAAVVAGYDLIMPVYRGQVGEREMSRLIAYIRSLAEVPR